MDYIFSLTDRRRGQRLISVARPSPILFASAYHIRHRRLSLHSTLLPALPTNSRRCQEGGISIPTPKPYPESKHRQHHANKTERLYGDGTASSLTDLEEATGSETQGRLPTPIWSKLQYRGCGRRLRYGTGSSTHSPVRLPAGIMIDTGLDGKCQYKPE